MVEILAVAYCTVGYLLWLSLLRTAPWCRLTDALLLLPMLVLCWSMLLLCTFLEVSGLVRFYVVTHEPDIQKD